MIAPNHPDSRALRRLLANGPLDAVPRRPADQDLLVRLAAATLEPGREYPEREINERLKEWLDAFAEPHGIDHVTLRRMLVDSRRLVRTRSGSAYEVNAAAREELDALRGAEPRKVLEDVRRARAARKARRSEGASR